MPTRTSATHPIRVDFLPKEEHGLSGQLGMTFAPGKKAQSQDGYYWDRELTTDLARLKKKYATDVLVSLIEEHDLAKFHIQALPKAAADAGIELDRFAIPDGGVPEDAADFAGLVSRTIGRLRAGKTVVIHCRGGLGRTGVLAAVCLRALGVDPERAMAIIRATRPGTIENAAQEDFVRTVNLSAAPKELEWLGTLQREKYNESFVAERDAIADAARKYDWPTVFRLLEGKPALVNGWRVGGPSWYTPLHQAARAGSPAAVIEELLARGAWRTLRTSKGERAVDIARSQGHEHLVALLEPVAIRQIDARDLERIKDHFHNVIRGRIRNIPEIEGALRLPELTPLTEQSHACFWFPVPGMCGGFKFWLAPEETDPKLISESWCRVVDGSGERHEVTPVGARMVDKGFV
jgi:protein-tyrosine phosphatase